MNATRFTHKVRQVKRRNNSIIFLHEGCFPVPGNDIADLYAWVTEVEYLKIANVFGGLYTTNLRRQIFRGKAASK